MKTATFSNGNSHTYKGKRTVSAAWMFTTPDGYTLNGFSVDDATADKTARANLREWKTGKQEKDAYEAKTKFEIVGCG